ncbi:MAG: hypothetical protein ABJA35_10230 [Parafilimonas sp.]
MRLLRLLFPTFLLFIFFSCTKDYSNEVGNSSPFAQGTLKDSLGDCLFDSAFGAFYSDSMPGLDTNYVAVKMNITQPGTYNIVTDLQNGLRFADSGYIYNKGDTIIHLKPTGTPLTQQATFFTINFNNDVCYLFVHVQ